MPIKNIHVICKKIKNKVYSEEEGNYENYFYRLFIINDFKNPKEIDLNKSDINNIPAKIFYYYDNIKIEKDIDIILNKNLNNFINTPFEYDNPLNPIFNENENKNSFINKCSYIFMYILFFLLILFIGVYFKYDNNIFFIFGIPSCALFLFLSFILFLFLNAKITQ